MMLTPAKQKLLSAVRLYVEGPDGNIDSLHTMLDALLTEAAVRLGGRVSLTLPEGIVIHRGPESTPAAFKTAKPAAYR